jgi:dTMP kinase
MSKRGILIAVEGIDGAGKTAQVKMLHRALKRADIPVVKSKEPTTGQMGKHPS